jgi:ABC-type transport system involved in cytochrome bd biosynthesis fused ATPase/permease subunit
METVISGHSGKNLTNSIATKLSLARAYLNPGKILLIDELPNAMLSSKTGDNLRSYIDESKDKKTIIMATYRHDFLNRANSIVMLRGTEAPLVGPRELMARHFNKGKAA